jgi:hypothetical protein
VLDFDARTRYGIFMSHHNQPAIRHISLLVHRFRRQQTRKINVNQLVDNECILT